MIAKPITTQRLTELIEATLQTPRFEQATNDHRRHLRHTGELFCEFAGFDPPIGSITTSMLELFEAWLRDTHGIKSDALYRSRIAGLIDMAMPGGKLSRKGGGSKKRTPPLDESEGTLWHLFKTSYQKRKRSSVRTAKQYRVQLTHFRKHLGHEPGLMDLTDDILDDFINQHSEGRSVPATNKAYWSLVALWRHAFDLGLVKKRPTIQPLVEPDVIPFAWFKEEVEQLLRTCATLEGMVGEVPKSLWWLGIHWFIWSSGERIGAVLAMKREHVDINRGEAFVPAEIRKGRRKPKIYPLLPQAVEVLRQFHDIERELLFPWPFNECTIYHRYTEILKAAGLPSDRKCKFHRMRRTFASYVEAAGGNSTAYLGHSSRRVTERSYLDPRIVTEQNVAALLPALSTEVGP